MHPFYSLYAAEVWQTERRHEAERAARLSAQRPGRRRMRIALGYRLVEVGLRLAVHEPAVAR